MMKNGRFAIWIGVVGTFGIIVIWGLLNINRANAPVVMGGTAVPPVPTLNAAVVTEGKALYAQHCASCHGADLQGAPDWKTRLADGSLPPPSHDSSGHTWHHEDSLLLNIIADGGDPQHNSKMPAFQATLTEAQMVAILEFIKSTWGREEREFQWWMTATRDGVQPASAGER
jgi:mono/diheme cytochrome c family protein